MKRPLHLSIAAVVAVVVALAGAPAAHAALGYDDLPFDPATCSDGDILTLVDDVTGGQLDVGCNLTLDLKGNTLDAAGIVIAPGKTLIIDDTVGGGRVLTAGPHAAAGIQTTGASLVVNGGTVTAEGGNGAAGIGGGRGGDGGTVTINGGTVTATGNERAAGIGGGRDGKGGTTTITGGTVTATGGYLGAGIGAGRHGEAGTVVIGDGATVFATGDSYTAIGSDDYLGSLTIAGTLHLPAGALTIPGGDTVVITSTGKVLGRAADPTQGATITGTELRGTGQIDNAGVIALDESLVQVPVNNHNYLVSFDTQSSIPNPDPVRVFGPDFDSGYRTAPTPPTGAAWSTTMDATGPLFTESTALTGDRTVYALSGLDLLKLRIADCADGDTITLDDDYTLGGVGLNCSLTLDLNGHTLETEGIRINTGKTLTVNDSGTGGTLIAKSSNPHWAGIRTYVATLIVNGGTIVATGYSGSAGIGGGDTMAGGTVVINGGTVNATGSAGAAAIGGGADGDGGTITINGGTVTATGGSIGIGGGAGGRGATLTIGEDAIVTAHGSSNVIGGGSGGIFFGSLTLDGTLYLPSGRMYIPDTGPGAEITIGETGRILGKAGDETNGAILEGPGQIDNGGAIALDAHLVLVDVIDHNYRIEYVLSDPGTPPPDQRVFAADMASGYRDIPMPAPGLHWYILRGGSGLPYTESIPFTDTTPIFSDTLVFAVTDVDILSMTFASCTDGDTITLDQDYESGPLFAACDLTLDLNGHTLEIIVGSGLTVASGKTLTVIDSAGEGALVSTSTLGAGIDITDATLVVDDALVFATSESDGAGIGGSCGSPGGTLIVNGGQVRATGADGSAGIGGACGGDGGTTTINDGIVIATGGDFGAGIGGGDGGDGGVNTINGGAVLADGGDEAAGIGGGSGGDGGQVTIAAGAFVAAGGGATAVGHGEGGGDFGSLTLAGVLYAPDGVLWVPDSNTTGPEITIESTGALLGDPDAPTDGATVPGDGQIANGGVIALTEVHTTVTDHNYLVTFDTGDAPPIDPVRVFAPSFDAGYRTLPALTAPDAWNTATDGSGDWFGAASTLSSDLTLYALTDATLTITAESDSVDQGGSLTFTVTGVGHDGLPVDTSGVVLTSSVGTDVIDGLTVTFPHASPHVITATLGTATAQVTVQVIPAPVPPPAPAPAPGPDLPATGVDPLPPLGLALLLLVAGTVLVVVRRRTATRQ